MKQKIIVDEAKGFELMTIEADNKQVLYDASWVCKKLGYTNISQELKYIPEEYKFKFRNILNSTTHTPKIYLNKFGLELMVMRCRKPVVWPYQKWIIEEVLESIYTNGGYIMGQEKLPEDERNKLLSRIHNLEQEVNNARTALGMTGESKKRDAKEYGTLAMQFRTRADQLDEEGDNILSNMNEAPHAEDLFQNK